MDPLFSCVFGGQDLNAIEQNRVPKRLLRDLSSISDVVVVLVFVGEGAPVLILIPGSM